MAFEPTFESLRQHQVPAWFHDAKLGIMVTWGLYSVPGWATPSGALNEFASQADWTAYFKTNPYAEWYLNTMKIEDSPTHQYHIQTYGEHFSYDDFVSMFNQASRNWNPDHW